MLIRAPKKTHQGRWSKSTGVLCELEVKDRYVRFEQEAKSRAGQVV